MGTLVGTLTAIDPDDGDTHTFELLNDVGEFEVVGDELRTAAELDIETQPSYALAIRATDSGGLSHDERVDVDLVASLCATGTTGGGAPHDLMQPSLALRHLIASTDIPGDGSVGTSTPAGAVTLFAGRYDPRGWLSADGQELAIADFPELFDAVGSTYGGDGVHTFALPDLRGRAAIFEGQGEGLSERALGWSGGAEQRALSADELPTHDHPLPGMDGTSDPSGGSAAKSVVQPSAALLGGIAQDGPFPPTFGPEGFSTEGWFVGRIFMGIGTELPYGTIPADGTILPTDPESALHVVIGSSFGGDGETSFAIPFISGRAAVSAGQGPGLSDRPLAWTGGAESVSLDVPQMAAHSHSIPGASATEPTGGDEAHPNMQPSIALRWIVRVSGQYPVRPPGPPVQDFVGEVALFAGDYAPAGWELAEGQRLSIVDNPDLYAILGAYFGGDWLETMALPDLRGRVPVHVGEGPSLSSREIGWQGGAEETTLSESQLAPHAHDLVTCVPEP